MEQTVKERLKIFLLYKNIGQNKFSDVCGLSSGFVNNIRNSIQPNTLNRIAKWFPDLNKGWLLTGEGEMLRAEQHIGDIKNSTIVGGTVSGSGNMISNNASESESYKKEVEHLKIIINEKDKQLAEKERIINLLMKQTINSH